MFRNRSMKDRSLSSCEIKPQHDLVEGRARVELVVLNVDVLHQV